MAGNYANSEEDDAGTPTAEELLESMCTSNWLKESLKSALQRDPVDAARDAELLALVMSSRAETILALHGGSRSKLDE